MPIYAYKCGSCGHARDVLQKVSDAPLTTCPECGAAAFAKQITAAGFQLKGSGWYVTDFRNNGSSKASSASKDPASGEGAAAKPADGGDSTAKPATESKPDVSASTPKSPDSPAASAGSGARACA